MSWTQPACRACWDLRNPNRTLHTLKSEVRVEERCCFCGMPTSSGIYVRVDPSTVGWPSDD